MIEEMEWDVTSVTDISDAFAGVVAATAGWDNRDWPEQWITDLAASLCGGFNIDNVYNFSKTLENAFNSGCIVMESES